MADELSNEGEELEAVEPVEAEAPEGEDTAPPEPEKIEFTEKQQKVFNEAIGRKVAKIHEAESRAERLARELEETRSRIPKELAPEVPDIPDPYDPDFKTKINEREKQIAKRTEWDINERARSERDLEQHYNNQRAEAAERTRIVQVYTDRAVKLGVKPQDLQQAGPVVGNQLHPILVQHILEEPLGPQMTVYLANNQLIIDQLASMSPTQAVIYLDSQVKPKAAAARKLDLAPEPVDHLTGRGRAEGERGPKGARFE